MMGNLSSDWDAIYYDIDAGINLTLVRAEYIPGFILFFELL